MPSLLSRLFGARIPAPENTKASRAQALLAMHALGQPRWTVRDVTALAHQGFERNAVVYRCVRMIAEAAASVPWRLYEGRDEITAHPLLELISRPNPGDVAPTLFEALFTNLLLFGNAYVEAVSIDGAPRELYVLRPDRMKVIPGRNGWPMAFDYTVSGERVRYDMTLDGVKPILHLKLFHPLDDYYGFAPIAAAQIALDIHNSAGSWNKALLDNSARPSGALVYTGQQNGHLTDEQFERLKNELEDNFQSTRNAGRPMLLEGGLDWKALSLSPKDMDFAESKSAAAREIALAFGVPPLVLGIPGDNHYANYQEANRAFWRQTIIPLINRTQKSFERWLAPGYAETFTIDYDIDRIEALADERATEWTRIGAATFLTDDEKREAVGYGKKAAGVATGQVADAAAVSAAKLAEALRGMRGKYSDGQPRDDHGRWTPGGVRVDNADAETTSSRVAATSRFGPGAAAGMLNGQFWQGKGADVWTLCTYTNGNAKAWPGHINCPAAAIGK